MVAVENQGKASFLALQKWPKEVTGTIAVRSLQTSFVNGPNGDLGQSVQVSVGPKVQKPGEEGLNKWAAKEELEGVLVKLNRVSKLVKVHHVQVSLLSLIYYIHENDENSSEAVETLL